MMSPPQGDGAPSGAGGLGSPTSPPSRSSSLFLSLGKLLWSPSSGAETPKPGSSSDFMTQSPRRGADSSHAARPSDTDLAGALPTSPDKRGLLDIFSPMFTFFSGGGPKIDAGGGREGAAPGQGGGGGGGTAAASIASPRAAPGPPARPAPPPPPPQQQQAGEEELDEFDPYVFIRSLPPRPLCPSQPVCLPRKTRGTHAVSLVLDLDETLLHSSITPLPTYDIVFPVHFNSINYQARARLRRPSRRARAARPEPRTGTRQVYVRKRPHMDEFMEHVSKHFEIIVFTASQKVRPIVL